MFEHERQMTTELNESWVLFGRYGQP